MSLPPQLDKDKWNFSADRTGNWRWTVTTPGREVLRSSAEAYKTRADADPMVTADIGNMANLYLQGADPKNPLASPNFANLRSLPPLLIHVGRDEVLLDDSIKLDQKATADGVGSTLEIWEDMIHVWHAFHPMLPEGKQAIVRVGSFLRERWAAA